MKKNKGITLIALIITIIVMLILVVITLTVTLGENGLFAKTKQAKETQEEAEILEQLIGAMVLNSRKRNRLFSNN